MAIINQNIEQISNELKKAIAQVLDKYGYSLRESKTLYDNTELSFRITAGKVKNGKVQLGDFAESYLRFRFESRGIKNIPNIIGGSTCWVKDLGECTIINYRNRARGQPIQVETPSGEKYNIAIDAIESFI